MLTFSVITPNLNSGRRLTGTVQSVVEQGVDLEHLIIDGASTDMSLELAKSLRREHSGLVNVNSEPDRGIYDAMNKGIRLAKGRYIYFLGAGDLLLPAVLRRVAELLPSHLSGFIYGNVLSATQRDDGLFDEKEICGRNICHQAIFYGREVFALCGDYDLKYPRFADWGFNIRCFGRKEVTKSYIPLTIAQFEPGGASSQGDPAFERDRFSQIRYHLGLKHYLRTRVSHFWRRHIYDRRLSSRDQEMI